MLSVGVGTVLQFDGVRGFGFIGADDGGDDVFVHASALAGDERAFIPGARVSFEAVRSERGRRATAVRILGQPDEHRFAAQVPASATSAQPAAERSPVRLSSPQPAGTSTRSAADPGAEADMCDLLTSAEFGRELTDILLDVGGDLTAAQIVAIRSRLLASAVGHGWVEG